jgi:hypothetical protein
MPCCWVRILQHFTPNYFIFRVWLFKKNTDTQGKYVLHKWVTKGQAIIFDSHTLKMQYCVSLEHQKTCNDSANTAVQTSNFAWHLQHCHIIHTWIWWILVISCQFNNFYSYVILALRFWIHMVVEMHYTNVPRTFHCMHYFLHVL